VREIPQKSLCPHVISNSCTENKKIGDTGLDVPIERTSVYIKRGMKK